MSLSPADFFTAAAFERECASVFARGWIPVCRSEDLAEAGMQRSVAIANRQLLVVRGRDGAVAALSNVCRHRGMTLVEGEARGGAIRCPYHLWTYGLDGALQAAPFMPAEAVEGCRLPRYAAAEWGGFVFVTLEPDPQPLAEVLAPLAAALEPDRLASLRAGYRIVLEHEWNWKVMVENFGESYHHIGIHPQTLEPIWAGGRTDATPSGAHWIDIRHPDHAQAGELRVFAVFPLFMLAATPASGAVILYRMNPLGPERIALEVVGLAPPEAAADAETMESAKAQVLAVHLEDMAVCERVQRGLRAPDAVLGPLSPVLEAGVARFRAWLDAHAHVSVLP